jgi:hypothetical protein
MDKKSAMSLSGLIAEAADTIELLLETTDKERSQIEGEARAVIARLRALDGNLSDEIFEVVMKSLR